RVFLFSRGPEFGGFADLVMTRSGGGGGSGPIVDVQVPFGTNGVSRHIKRNDTFLLGKSPETSDPLDPTLPAFADSSLLVLEMTESELYDGCMEQCASPESWVGYCERTSLWNDDDIGSLSRVDVAAGFSTAAGGTGAENAI